MRTKRGPILELLRPQVAIFIKMFKGHKEARIYNITLFVTHVLMFIMVQLLYIPFRMRCMYNKMLVDIAIFLHLW